MQKGEKKKVDTKNLDRVDFLIDEVKDVRIRIPKEWQTSVIGHKVWVIIKIYEEDEKNE